MNRFFAFLIALISAMAISAETGDRQKFSFNFGDTLRTYSMYVPADINPGAPLVVYIHGYGSKTRWRPDLNAIADSKGFAVCYPDGMPDSRGKDGWKVGYPPQETMEIDEAAFFRSLLDEVCRKFDLSRENVFAAGMSNGGDLCYQFAYTDPELFRAYASVAGLTFECTYLNNNLTVPVPFLEIHGNADKTSMWQGDHENSGGWGAYIPVPLAVAAVAYNNRCTKLTVESLPSKADSGRTVTRYLYSDAPSGMDVEVYEIEGGAHSWGSKDVDTAEIIWRFFEQYLKP
ncbi:MAG: esterase [Muribaculum sp.]|nr:esterase [Muribaculum sp.]